jgi:valyl-tRNA synthetase
VARYQRMRRPRGLLPDGLGRQRPAHRAPGRELLRRALRPVGPLRRGLPAARTKPAKKRQDFEAISRRNFIELCEELTAEDEQVFEDLFRRSACRSTGRSPTPPSTPQPSASASGRSCATWPAARPTQEAPTLWDTTFQTAVAQAELEDRERPGAYHDLAFHRSDGGDDVVISTTRPELLVSCVALVAHPDDERYQPLFGSTVTTRSSGSRCRSRRHHLAEPDKGTGIAMICTFGDLTDVIWWRELDLPTRAVIGKDGRFPAEAPTGSPPTPPATPTPASPARPPAAPNR